jgi:hypothetical protein
VSKSITKKLSPLVWTLILLALEGLSFVRWLFFGQQSSPFDWQLPIGLVVALWGIGQIAETLDERIHLEFQPRTHGTEAPKDGMPGPSSAPTPGYEQFNFRLREI